MMPAALDAAEALQTAADLLLSDQIAVKRRFSRSDAILSPRSFLDPQPSFTSDSEATDRSPSLNSMPQISEEDDWSSVRQAVGSRASNASERLRMVITDSDTLQKQIRQHLFVSQGRHMSSADCQARPASIDCQRRCASVDFQMRRASHDGAPISYLGHAAVIRARSTTMPACMRDALPPAVLAARAASGITKGDSPPGTYESSGHIGGAVNAKMVSRSIVDDMMAPLQSLDRSVSEYLNEG